jgi:hypothetical protein
VPRVLRLLFPCAFAIAFALIAPAGAGAAGWLPITTALNGTNGAIGTPRVAVDDAGDAYAVWAEGSFIEVSKRPVGGTFETPQTIDNGANGKADVADIGVDGAGNAVVVWRTHNNSGGLILQIAFRRAADSSFGPGATLTLGNSTLVGAPRIAVNRAGDAVVAYKDHETSSDYITAHLGTATGNATDFIATRRNQAATRPWFTCHRRSAATTKSGPSTGRTASRSHPSRPPSRRSARPRPPRQFLRSRWSPTAT